MGRQAPNEPDDVKQIQALYLWFSGKGAFILPLIVHEVADYAAWKRVFDAATGVRKAAGEIRYQLL
jgi:hypothetical protein